MNVVKMVVIGLCSVVCTIAGCSQDESCTTGEIRACTESDRPGMQVCSDRGTWWSCDGRVHQYTADEQGAVDVFDDWASAFRAHNYVRASSLVVAGGGAQGYVDTARDQWDAGLELYYEFECAEVYYTDETELITDVGEVAGNVTMYQGSGGPAPETTGFYAAVRKVGGQWKIESVNMTMGRNWMARSWRDSDPAECPNCTSGCGPSPSSW